MKQANKKKVLVYIHGKGGNSQECEHYATLFPDHDVLGVDYKSEMPWDVTKELNAFFQNLQKQYDSISIIANSIGAYFAMISLDAIAIENAFFISPIVNMEKLIYDMMTWANTNEKELQAKNTIDTSFGETLSYDYLTWVREHPITWNKKTKILHGSKDHLQSIDNIKEFSKSHNCELKVIDGAEHWFHTAEQMKMLDDWIVS
ncbi:MAG: alpha/beta hydrolase [Clostridia bacterium]|nr:alpha/beta hydrolase [Clostridia bacterium]